MANTSGEGPTKAQWELLKEIYQFYLSHKGEDPTSEQIRLASPKYTSQIICNRKKELIDQDLLEKTNCLRLTSKALKLLKDDAERFLLAPTDFQIIGQVQAGDVLEEDLKIYGEHSGEMITIPSVNTRRRNYVMQVSGKSMVHEGIFEGDFVIVEERNLSELKDGDLIVTKFLSQQFTEIEDEDLMSDILNNPDNYRGPTLKYFFRKGKVFRLSWKKETDISNFTFETKAIIPAGKVISVIRNIV